MQKNVLVPVIVIVLVIGGVAWYLTNTSQKQMPAAAITNFDECVAAGYPVIEKVPPECATPDGRVFVQQTQTEDSERAEVPSKIETVSVDSGLQKNRGMEPVVAFRKTVRSPNAPWLRLRVSEYNLGKNSFITVTSLKDGDEQKLNAATLQEWDNGTAYFNGDAVEVMLTVAPGENGIFFRVNEIIAGVVADTPEPTGLEE